MKHKSENPDLALTQSHTRTHAYTHAHTQTHTHRDCDRPRLGYGLASLRTRPAVSPCAPPKPSGGYGENEWEGSGREEQQGEEMGKRERKKDR